MRTVFFDVDTQLDFIYPTGALYVPGAEKIVPNIATRNRFAAAQRFSLISTMDAHSENDSEFRIWPPHCIAGTLGQNKPAATLLDRRVVIPNQQHIPALDKAIDGAQQFLVEKQVNDCFTNINLPALLKHLDADRYVVYGVVTEICVQCALDGLLQTGRHLELVTDAIQHLDGAAAEAMIQRFLAAGGARTTASIVTRVPQTQE